MAAVGTECLERKTQLKKSGNLGQALCREVLVLSVLCEAQGHLCRREGFNMVLVPAGTVSCLDL